MRPSSVRLHDLAIYASAHHRPRPFNLHPWESLQVRDAQVQGAAGPLHGAAPQEECSQGPQVCAGLACECLHFVACLGSIHRLKPEILALLRADTYPQAAAQAKAQTSDAGLGPGSKFAFSLHLCMNIYFTSGWHAGVVAAYKDPRLYLKHSYLQKEAKGGFGGTA